MSEEVSNLDKLTEKIYLEGLQKAEQKAREIIDEAEKRKEKVLSDANTEAERIINEARKEASLEKRGTESEIKLKSKQLISDLKKEVRHLLAAKILENNINTSFSDQDFLQKLILEIARYWKSSDALELKLPESVREKVDKAFEKDIAKNITNLSITFSNQMVNGFRISEKSDTYEIAFSEDDFIELFRPYLSEKTQKFLFAEGS